MARKKDSEDAFFGELAEVMGGSVLRGTGDSKYFIDSGNLGLNWINSGRFMGGGYPTGITEAYGPSATSKTLLGYIAAGWCQKRGGIAVWLDSERATNEGFAVTAGHVNENQLVVLRPNHIEHCQDLIVATAKRIRAVKKYAEIPILFVWDSIGAAMCEREFRELQLPPNYTKAQYKEIVRGKEQPGERAKACSTFLRKINPFLDDWNASLFVVNQTRDKIGVQYGSPETTAGGGKGLPFYANTRIRTSAHKQIIDKKLSAGTIKVPSGVNLKFANKKARACAPYRVVEGVRLYFNHGINPVSGLLIALINSGRAEKGDRAGVYKINEPWAGGQEISFRASLAENEVPLDVLYKCPAVVDAQSEEQIREYLGVFAQAIELAHSSDMEESDLTPEDQDEESMAEKLDVEDLLGVAE